MYVGDIDVFVVINLFEFEKLQFEYNQNKNKCAVYWISRRVDSCTFHERVIVYLRQTRSFPIKPPQETKTEFPDTDRPGIR